MGAKLAEKGLVFSCSVQGMCDSAEQVADIRLSTVSFSILLAHGKMHLKLSDSFYIPGVSVSHSCIFGLARTGTRLDGKKA